MRSERFNFPNAKGEQLAATLDMPLGPPTAFALFAHCFTCGKDNRAARYIAEQLTIRGIAVLRFDFAATDFSSTVDDLVAAADHLRASYHAPAILIGHSLGGAAVLAAAHRIPEAHAVVTIAAPYDPGHVTALHKALLVFHSPTDDRVGIDNASHIFQAAKHPKSFVSLAGADHLLSKKSDAIYVADVIAAWAERYLDQPEIMSEAEVDVGTVLVRETHGGKFQQEILTGPHRLLADEPEKLGGLNSGPGPYDFLLAGLGACTSMTIRLYADFKKIPLKDVSVRLSHGKIHVKDCETCDTKVSTVDHIERIVTLEGDLDDEQRKRLMEIADKCPVHKTLESKIDIHTVERRV
jgi:uncharacterized OsmC-like protein/alpha/beta superfamily hydrolase